MSPIFGPLKFGTKVQIHDFPPPANQSVPFDFNGLVGIVQGSQRVGFGLNNKPVYQYDVFFEDVEVPFSNPDPSTGRLLRGTKKGTARQLFEETYLVKVGDPEPPKVVVPKEVAPKVSEKVEEKTQEQTQEQK